ncbi:MAG TPA: cupin domain-containing protein [Phycisphaerae bacterium]|nr:cupin domain-containing protein [Phycisphaerae bacterium]
MIVKKADEAPAKRVDIEGAVGVWIRLLIHDAEGAPNFYMRQFDVEPGGCTPLHQHDWEHEVYVLSGDGVVSGAGSERAIGRGDCVFVPPGEVHQFRNTGDGTLQFLCLVPADSG